ncbi:MAG: hypothetical protein N2690_00010 [Rhodocyclaceae bacterium]|nr:hypothetical protein [Rhodocyclaceae bacterium]
MFDALSLHMALFHLPAAIRLQRCTSITTALSARDLLAAHPTGSRDHLTVIAHDPPQNHLRQQQHTRLTRIHKSTQCSPFR